MTYKSKIIRKLVIGGILFAIVCAFYLSGMYLWGDTTKNEILNIIFGLASVGIGICIESLFKVKDLQGQLCEMSNIERTGVIEHCRQLNENDGKILKLQMQEKELAIKEKYKGVLEK